MRDHLHLHFVVLLFGFTAILGKLITIPTTELVFYRMFIAAIGMVGIAFFMKTSYRLPLKTLLPILGIGGIVALHWITFFEAVEVSNVAVTLGCMASATLFTSILEPIIERKKVFWVEVVIGLAIIVGLYVITQFAFHYRLGIIYALISAFLASLFGVLNRYYVKDYSPMMISLYEMIAGAACIFVYLLWNGGVTHNPLTIPTLDVIYILILALVCTAYAFVAIVYLLKNLSAFVVSLAINMEPVYGIILAFFIFGESEQMDAGFYVGTLIILGSIFVYPLLRKTFVLEEQ